MAYVRVGLYDNRVGFVQRYACVDDDEGEEEINMAILEQFPPPQSVIAFFSWIGRKQFEMYQELYPAGEIILAHTSMIDDLDDFRDIEEEEENRVEWVAAEPVILNRRR